MAIINYSIIIPHKNSPKLLQRCIDSIPFREDIQVIVVDDNSDCDKVDFEHFPGVKEKHVEVIFTEEGKGAGYARNVGLRHAKGKWILFADADDLFIDNFYKTIDLYINASYDIIYFKTYDLKTILINNLDSVFVDIDRAAYFNQMWNNSIEYLKFTHIVPWSKLIKKECIDKYNHHFDETLCSNDVMFSIRLALSTKAIYKSDNYIYSVTKPQKTNLTSRLDFKSGKERLLVTLERNRILQENGYPQFIASPLGIVWRYRKLGIKSIFEYCFIIYKSTTPFFIGISKFAKNPKTYLR